MVKVGVIGAGNMGRNHVRVYSELPGVELLAIADPDEGAAEVARRYGCRYYRSYEEMLRREELEAVSIAAPTVFHHEIALTCIDMGIHILVEKPLADTFQRAAEIASRAERAGLVLAVGHIERYNPAVRRLREMVEQGVLGRTISLTSKRVGIFPPQIKDANVYLDLAVHDIDVFNFLLSRMPERVFSRAERVLAKDREDQALIFLEYGDVACVTQVNWITPVKIRRLSATGSSGYAELDFISQELRVFESVINRGYDSFGEFVIRFGSPRVRDVDVERAEPLKLELMDFIESIEEGRRPAVGGAEGVAAVRIALLAQRSAQEGTFLKVEV